MIISVWIDGWAATACYSPDASGDHDYEEHGTTEEMVRGAVCEANWMGGKIYLIIKPPKEVTA
ncbi:MAG: hypothetical protein EBR13_01800 [Rhodobacteraceae bacterium]|nr:hypothetical protein [Paracoccaceae bacterium]